MGGNWLSQVREVAGDFVQLHVADMGRVHGLVPAFAELALDVVFKRLANDSALGQPQNQAGAYRLIDGEQLELLAQHAVIAAFGFGQLFELGVELFLVEECSRVQSLQLLARGVAFPVCAGDGQQLERAADVTGAGDVPPAAKIDEFALSIERQRFLVGQTGLDVLDLELLSQLLTECEGFVARHFEALETLVRLDDLLHLGFDPREVFIRERVRQLEVVIKTGGGGWPERQLHAFKQPHHGLRHHMSATMPHHGERLRIFLSQQPQANFAGVRQQDVQINWPPVDLR